MSENSEEIEAHDISEVKGTQLQFQGAVFFRGCGRVTVVGATQEEAQGRVDALVRDGYNGFRAFRWKLHRVEVVAKGGVSAGEKAKEVPPEINPLPCACDHSQGNHYGDAGECMAYLRSEDGDEWQCGCGGYEPVAERGREGHAGSV